MKLATAVQAPPLNSQGDRLTALAYAVVLVALAVAQLFRFEEFIPIIEDYWLAGGHGTAVLVACVIVISEVFALPYLLRMPLSPLMRVVSMSLSVLVPVIWLSLSVYGLMFAGNNALDGGLLGAKIFTWLPLQLLISLGLLIVAIYAALNTWPLRKK